MSAAQIQEGIWKPPGTDRTLGYRLWRPANARGLLVVVHGFAEHGGRYQPFAEVLAAKGFAVACPDLWGHGRSGGARGDVERFEWYLDDLEGMTRDLFLPNTGLSKMAVFGHSMGGLIALHWALRSPEAMRALVLQSPFFGAGFRVPQWKESLRLLLQGWWPAFAIPLGIQPAWLSHDPMIIKRYQTDPLVHRQITVRAYGAIQDAILQASTYAVRLRVPTLVLTGDEDHLISLEACARVVQRFTCEHRVVHFPGAYHELHHEAVREQVVADVAQWIEAHV